MCSDNPFEKHWYTVLCSQTYYFGYSTLAVSNIVTLKVQQYAYKLHVASFGPLLPSIKNNVMQ